MGAKSLRTFSRIILALTGLMFLGFGSAVAQQIWFNPPDNLPRGGRVANEGFPLLFDREQEWREALSKVSVFQLTPYYAAAGTDEQIKKITGFLSSRQIDLAVGMQSLPVAGCGRGVEGMAQPGQPGGIARRLKQLGADVKYFALDEPLEYGHLYTGRDACRYSIQEVARRLAETIHDLRASYPNVKIVDFEVPTNQPLEQWTATLNQWLDAYQAETGLPLNAMAMDTFISKPWYQAAVPTVKILHQRGAQVGIFLDAHGGPAVTDDSWMTEARRYAGAIGAAKLNLDFVIVSTWTGHPRRFLPESSPLALTSLIDYFANIRDSHSQPK